MFGFDVPPVCCSPRQHVARAGSGLAKRQFICRKTGPGGSGSERIAAREAADRPVVIGQPAIQQVRPFPGEREIGEHPRWRHRFNADLTPVGTQFDCRDLRQNGADPLPHLKLRLGYGNDSVPPDDQPTSESFVAGPRDQRTGIFSRPEIPRDQKPTASRRSDKQLAA